MKISDMLRDIANQLDSEDKPAKEVDYWPSSIDGQKIPRITGNVSIDYAAAMIGMQNMQPTPERDANLREEEARWRSERASGPFSANALSTNDAAYLWHRHHDYRLQTTRDLFYDVCSGANWDIANAKALGDRINPSMGEWQPDNTALIDVVDALFAQYRK